MRAVTFVTALISTSLQTVKREGRFDDLALVGVQKYGRGTNR